MSQWPKTLILPAAAIAVLAMPAQVLAERGPALERNETAAQVTERYYERLALCQAPAKAQREQCRADAKARRDAELAEAEAGHAAVQARRAERDRMPGADKRASLAQAGEEELDVQHKLALSRCEEEAPERRKSCRDVARARYGK